MKHMTEQDVLKLILANREELPKVIKKPTLYMYDTLKEDIQVSEYGELKTYLTGSYIVLGEDSLYPTHCTEEEFNKSYTQEVK